ncbi:MAG: hypothetical protein D6731_22310, partial [Planctomycetota bacterium]
PEAEAPPSPRPKTFSERVLTDSQSFVSDAVRGPDRDAVPGGRPRPLLEIGDPFLGQTPIQEGIELPTGAVWNPSLLVYGTFRTAVQVFDNGLDRAPVPGARRIKPRSEWANRLDLFANLQLSGTERIVLGFRPLDDVRQRRRGYTGYEFEPNRVQGQPGEVDDWNDGVNARITTLFFEGDFGEIFPNLDPDDSSLLDIGFSVGRQNLLFQDGVMINGTMDAVGITRNSLRFLPYSSNTRITLLYGDPDLIQPRSPNRANPPSATNLEFLQSLKTGRPRKRTDRQLDLVALLTATDFYFTTMELDFAYTNLRNNGASGLFFGAAFHQRIGHFNTTFRWNGSVALGEERIDGPQDGHLLNVEISLDVPRTHPLIPDIIYFNAFLGIDRYRSAYRDPDNPSPLGRVGITYAGRGIGRYGSILGDQVTNDVNSAAAGSGRRNPLRFGDRAVGFALGYQMFLFGDVRKQLIVEVAGRRSTVPHRHLGAYAVGVRYQQAFLDHFILLVEGFQGKTEGMVEAYGARCEFIVKF